MSECGQNCTCANSQAAAKLAERKAKEEAAKKEDEIIKNDQTLDNRGVPHAYGNRKYRRMLFKKAIKIQRNQIKR